MALMQIKFMYFFENCSFDQAGSDNAVFPPIDCGRVNLHHRGQLFLGQPFPFSQGSDLLWCHLSFSSSLVVFQSSVKMRYQ